MIRRKLTRLEVTLDDTKELDELFSSMKTPQINLLNTSSLTATISLNNSSTVPKSSTSFHQKQLLIGKTEVPNSIAGRITPTRPAFLSEEAEEANSSE